MEKNLSERLFALRLPLAIAVVFIHSAEPAVNFNGAVIGVSEPNVFFDFFRALISEGIARSAVPAFFLLSGYFYFLKYNSLVNDYIKNIRSRVRTLLIPYLFWNILGVLILFIFQSVDFFSNFFSGRNAPVVAWDFYSYSNALLGLDGMPVAYQLWFLRDLIIICFIGPMIFVLLRSFGAIFLVGLLFVWFLGLWPLRIPSGDAFLFFCIGAYIAFNEKNIFYFDRFASQLTIAYGLLVVVDVLFLDIEWRIYLHRVVMALGVIVALIATNYLRECHRLKTFLLTTSPASFFIFCAHEPLLSGLRKVAFWFIRPESPFLGFLIFLMLPMLIAAALIQVHRTLSGRLPWFLHWSTGGK